MPHVFVESNWLFSVAAPGHHQLPTAVELLDRAKAGEFTIHLPSICIIEARQAILSKCQPRAEADAIRLFLSRSTSAGVVSPENARATRVVLDQYEQSLKKDLALLDQRLEEVATLSCVRVFSLDDQMLSYATRLALDGVVARPFDHAILAGILVSAERLWAKGERLLSFCEADSDLQPWDKQGRDRPLLRPAYDRAHLWVYGEFTLTWPNRPANFE